MKTKTVSGSSRPEKPRKQNRRSTHEATEQILYDPKPRVNPALLGRGPSAQDLEEIPEATGPFFRIGSVLNWGSKGPKEQVTIRLDQDVLKWLRSKGPGYQTKLNFLLRQHMLLERARKGAS